MVNFAVENWSSDIDDFDTVLAALETQIETVDNAKTIHRMSVVPVGSRYRAYLIYDT